MRKTVIWLFCAVMLSGCIQTKKIQSTYVANEVAFSQNKGVNVIKGSALVRQNGGGVVTCAGGNVALVPYSAYAAERMTAIYGNQIKGFVSYVNVEAADPRYLASMKYTTCDAQGFFNFSDIADGDYFVVTRVRWQVGYSTQGGDLMQRVSVSGGETKELVLSP